MSTSLGIIFANIFIQACSLSPPDDLVISLKAGKSGYPIKKSALSSQTRNTPTPVTEIAKQVTVRVLTKSGAGSGVIISRKGKTYTVLTCQHVVVESKDAKHSIMSADEKIHPARLKSVPQLRGLDLAIVEFDSEKSYRVAKLGNSNILSTGYLLYAAGFPNYNTIDKNTIEDTFDWGMKAFKLTLGKVNLILKKRSLPEGYSLGYTNEVKLGMSGGPVLNEKGELVGINGRLKYPLQGIDVFTFDNGTKPSIKEFERMEALSWAIPTVKFRALTE
ncbi:S1 family peptidase [Calothrix rhizosoleniae]|uniref:S1 family peptidase n=1 Tax=Calothrix rhizosoleniae TaxID=888997 RepID=UPI001F3F9412|nr:serine protease [Calothrix rhizosoleniae]